MYMRGLKAVVPIDSHRLLDMYSNDAPFTPFKTTLPSLDQFKTRKIPVSMKTVLLDMDSYAPGFPATIKSLGMKGLRGRAYSPSYTKLNALSKYVHGLGQDTAIAYDSSGNPIGATQTFDTATPGVTQYYGATSDVSVTNTPAPAAAPSGFWDALSNLFNVAPAVAIAAQGGQLVRTSTGQYVVPGGAGSPYAINANYTPGSPAVSFGLSTQTKNLLMYGALGLGAIFLLKGIRRKS